MVPKGWLVVTAVALMTGSTARREQAPTNESAARIVRIEAFLYYHDVGAFSPNILDSLSSFVLWNVRSGGGSATGYSNATLVKIVVEGDSPLGEDAVRLRVRAEESGQVKVDRLSELRLFRSGGYVDAIWLYDTGCEGITIMASITGNGSEPTTAHIPFDCGE